MSGISTAIASSAFGIWYDRMNRTYPFSTKTGTEASLGAASSAIGMLIQGRFSLWEAIWYGIIKCPPYSEFWFRMLDKQFGPGRVLLKTVLDQLIWRPILIFYLFIFNGLANGNKWAEVKASLKYYPRAIVGGWKVWPIALLINFRYVPVTYQSNFMSVLGF